MPFSKIIVDICPQQTAMWYIEYINSMSWGITASQEKTIPHNGLVAEGLAP